MANLKVACYRIPSVHSQLRTIVFAPVSSTPSDVQVPFTQAQIINCGWSENGAPSESTAINPNEKSAKLSLARGIVKVKVKSAPFCSRTPLVITPSITVTVKLSSSVPLNPYTTSTSTLAVKGDSPCSTGGELAVKNRKEKQPETVNNS